MNKFGNILLGGTFDHFHKGHENFLNKAISFSENLVIGVTSDIFARQKKLPFAIEPFETRKKSVEDYMKDKKVKYELTKIDDFFGPSLSGEYNFGALLVSKDNAKKAEEINLERGKKGLSQLKIIILDNYSKAEGGGMISSLRVRDGRINREGKVYFDQIWLSHDLILPSSLRDSLKVPLGDLVDDFKGEIYGPLFCVGDVTAKKLNEANLSPQVSIIDFRVGRNKIFSNIKELGFRGDENLKKIVNPAGTIKKELSKTLFEVVFDGVSKTVISIQGEDDLGVLPLALIAPLNSVIFYGQPNQGMVKVVVSEDIKEKCHKFLKRFQVV